MTISTKKHLNPSKGDKEGKNMKQENKKAAALGVAGLVAGAAGGLIGAPSEDCGCPEPVVCVDSEEALAELTGQLEGVQLQLDTCSATAEEMDQYSEVIANALAEDAAEETAMLYLSEENNQAQDWLNSNFNLTIEDDDDLSFSNFEDFDVDVLDYEDGDFDVTFEVKMSYFEDGDEDLDDKEYVKVTVEIRDFDAEEISFEEA
jgi:hypothetical protein